MRVVHFSTHDQVGGAAKAAYRIHDSLRRAGCTSTMVVAQKVSDDPQVMWVGGRSLIHRAEHRLFSGMDSLVRTFLIKPEATYFTDFFGTPISVLLPFLGKPEIIHLHWISGFLASKQIHDLATRFAAPVVWTLMDLAPLTGGCHYPRDCFGYTQKCGSCPQVHSRAGRDVSRWTWLRKQNNLVNLPITIVAPTQWVEERVKESSLFGKNRIVRIPLGVDVDIFRPIDQESAREVLRLPRDKKIVFFGASYLHEERKGYRYLIEALNYVSILLKEQGLTQDLGVALLTAGRRTTTESLDLPFPSFHLGNIQDDITLALAYQAADVLVSPSIEDAGPMMIIEALACGTPVVAFNAGGAPDFVRTLETGYIAKFKDSMDMARGIHAILSLGDMVHAVRDKCRNLAVRECSLNVQSRRYIDLYQELIKANPSFAWE